MSGPALFDPTQFMPTDVGGMSSTHDFSGGFSPPANSPGGYDPFDLPQYGGPMSAPISQGMFDALQGFKNVTQNNPVAQTGDIMSAIQKSLSGAGFHPAGMDPNSIIASFRPNTGFTKALDEASKTGFRTMDSYDPTNTGQSGGVINSVLSGDANNNVDPRTKGVLDALAAAFGTATGAPRFDTTDMFSNMRTVFEGDLANQTADLQEQYTGLGLGQGSSDRLNGIASNAGNARAKFNVGMADIQRQAFEDAENRRISALGTGGATASALQTGSSNAAAMLESIMSNERLPFEEKMKFAATVLEPAAARRLTAAQSGSQLDDNAMQRYMDEQKLATTARLTATDQAMQGGRDAASNALNLFDAESGMRNVADVDARRAYEEFVRTQGGGYEQMLEFLRTLPEQTVGVGPSTASQVGSGIAGGVDAAAGIIELINSLRK